MTRNLVILIMMFFLNSCDSGHSLQKHLQEYQARMANVLDADSPENIKVSLPPYPPLRELKQNISETSIKLFEFYNLKHCELYSLVAERNTSLGNLQLPSIRYIYERDLIDALQQCLSTTTEPKLQEKIKTWQKIKIRQLPMVWADLIQLSSELKQGFSANFGLVEGNQKDGFNQAKAALNYLTNIQQAQSANHSDLEQSLKTLLNNPLPAKLWLSQLTLTNHLRHSTAWLKQHTSTLECSGGISGKKMEYLRNVFQQFFIEKIQPIASQMNHYQYQLSPMLEKMTADPALSPSFKTYIHHLNKTGFENYQNAVQQHVFFWQDLFRLCNIKPGNH